MADTNATPESIKAELDPLREFLVGLAYDPGWPEDPAAHLKQMQTEIRGALRTFHMQNHSKLHLVKKEGAV